MWSIFPIIMSQIRPIPNSSSWYAVKVVLVFFFLGPILFFRSFLLLEPPPILDNYYISNFNFLYVFNK